MADHTSSDRMDQDKAGERTHHRKPHQKSRMGCAQCKTRRVKCDERFPSCGNCKRRREACSYNGSHASGTPDPSDGPNGVAALQQAHSSQLELMHQYCTATYATFVTLPRDQHLAQIEIPRMALAHDFLLDALFTLTSLHLAELRPESGEQLTEEAVRYQTSALASCRRSLANITADGERCRAMFHCSALLGVSAIALHCVRSRTASAPKPSETLLESASLWRGTGLMLSTAQKMLDPETFKRFFPLPDWFTMIVSSEPISPAHGYLERLRMRAKSLEPKVIPSPPGTPESPREESRLEAYSLVIDKLQKLFKIRRPETAAILNPLIEISPTYLGDLVDGQPVAAAIGLIYSVLLLELQNHWWARDYRKQLVGELLQNIPATDAELSEIAAWAVDVCQNHSEPT